MKPFRLIALAFLATTTLSAVPALAQSQLPSEGPESTQTRSRIDLRPTFMGKAYDIVGGKFDGKRGYLFRIWNRGDGAIKLRRLPGRFNKRRQVLGILSTGAEYSDGTLSFEGRDTLGEPLFVDRQRETLNPSPTGAFADRPANFIVVVEPEVDSLVYSLRGRTATATYASAQVEVLDLGGGSDDDRNPNLPPDPGEAAFATLEGVDANNNGIRDEVELALYEMHRDEPEVLAIQFLGARDNDTVLRLVAAGDVEALWEYELRENGERYAYCLNEMEEYRGGTKPWGWSGDRGKDLTFVSINTRERSDVYVKYHKYLNDFVVRMVEEGIWTGEFEDQYVCPTEPYGEPAR